MTAESGELERNLGFLEAMTIGGGTMIGAGMFILPGIAADGAGPASSVSFAIAGFVALLAALSLSELATAMPLAGGSYHYVNRSLGGLFGSIVGWGMWTGLMFATAFYMIGFGQYIVQPLPFLDGRVLVVLVGLIGLLLILSINYYGTEETGKAQNIMIGTQVSIVLLYLVFGLFFVSLGNLVDFAPRGASGIVATTGIVFVTFLGFEIIATVAGEIKKPGKLIPLTMILSVVLVTILYVVLMLVTTGVVPYQELGGSLVPVSDVASVIAGPLGVGLIVFAAAVAAISSSNSSTLAASRVIYAMGRDGLMSSWLNETHGSFNTPHRAVITTGLVTGLLISLGLGVEAIVELLAEVASFSFLVSYALVHISLVGFRYAEPADYDPAFRLPRGLYPGVPILGVVMTFVVISQMAPLVLIVGTGIVGIGVGWYFVYGRPKGLDAGVVERAYRSRGQQPYRVVVPVMNPETQRGLLRFAAAAAERHAGENGAELVVINVVQATDADGRNVEAERFESQRELLSSASEIAEGLPVNIRTEAVVAEEVGSGIVTLVDEVDADEVLLGWTGEIEQGTHVFGSVIDTVLADVDCELSLVKVTEAEVTTAAALAGPGPNTDAAVKRAKQLADAAGTLPVLLNAQRPDGDGAVPFDRGQEAIQWIAERAGLDPGEYESEVIVAEDIDSALVTAAAEYDIVCVGLSAKDKRVRQLFGSIAERIARSGTGNVSIVRGPTEDIANTD
ncbi:amino acid permease [Halorubrum vacuolatum]|uniref:Amino acid/polyamine/organocation transporter, APC superfamily n=1 Tax=Halorubrum vacuolatum TaxID=63740 RepID=A0A238WYX4_HALVU|nr:amino acid permease [Halorubrum vacuolatum]SNR51618.1 amino acid/polyamine/organocation transporter, APC superfamily [Halorubrum vacuolatum]